MKQSTPAQPAHNPFPRVWVYLIPIMSTATRTALSRMHTHWHANKLGLPYGSCLLLGIMRSVVELRQDQNPRVRLGIVAIMRDVLKTTPDDLLTVLRSRKLLATYGVLRRGDPDWLARITMLTNYVKSLQEHNRLTDRPLRPA